MIQRPSSVSHDFGIDHHKFIMDKLSNEVKTEKNDSLKRPMYGLKWWDIWALGITVVIGGDYFSWNIGLTAGFGSFVISSILMGFAYICLCLCISELTSALPFAGGVTA